MRQDFTGALDASPTSVLGGEADGVLPRLVSQDYTTITTTRGLAEAAQRVMDGNQQTWAKEMDLRMILDRANALVRQGQNTEQDQENVAIIESLSVAGIISEMGDQHTAGRVATRPALDDKTEFGL